MSLYALYGSKKIEPDEIRPDKTYCLVARHGAVFGSRKANNELMENSKLIIQN